MALTFPRVPVVEWFLDDGWQDISTDVRQNPAIQITQGRKDWSAKVSPSTCRFTLDDGPDHGDGDYNPENPLGAWFEQLDRNVPLRLLLPIANDTFGRTVSDGWGAADTGEAWTNAGGAGGSVQNSDWNVAAGVGTMSVPVAGGYRYSVLAGVFRNVTVTATTTVSLGDITGGAIEPGNLIVRRSGGIYYMTRVIITSAETCTVTIHHSVDGELVLPVTVPDVVGIASPKTIRVKMQAEGQTIRAKVYAPGAEPVGWQVEVNDNRITAAGQVGIRHGIASGNSNTKPIVFSTDDFAVASQRFCGEVVKMVPKTSTDHQDQRTEVEAAGARRRLSKGERTLRTALYRYITTDTLQFTVSDYWPLDFPPEFGAPGTNVVKPENAMRFVVSTGGSLKWGTPTGILPIERAVTLVPPGTGHSGQMYSPIDSTQYAAAQGCGAVWMQRVGSDREASVVLDLTVTQLFLHFQPGIAELVWLPSLTSVMTMTMPDVGDDTKWHVVGFGVKQVGGNAVFDLAVDDTEAQVAIAGTVGVPEGIQFSAFPETVEGFEVTNVVIINEGIFDGFNEWHFTALRDKFLGRVGETAGDRYERLCLEEGVSGALDGDPDDTPPMGPQRPLPFMKLVDECVDVVQGSAFDPQGTTGLALRTPRSVVNAAVAVTLDYADGTIAPEFGPVRDDQGLLNDVTAKRPQGGEYRVEKTSGPNNTSDPGTAPGAVGRVDTDAPVNVQTDAQLPDQAGWRVHQGTIPGARYPTITVDLAADALKNNAPLTQAVLDVGVDDRLTITGAQSRRIYDDVRLIARGWTESIGTAYQHRIVFNTTPATVYDGAVAESTETARAGSGSSTTNADFDAGTDTSLTVTVADQPKSLWTRDTGRFPFTIRVSGVVLEVTAISGAASPLTFTITQTPVNGVTKTIPAGSKVTVETPVYLVP